MTDRPRSITGGARYDGEPIPGGRSVTVRYYVAWVDVDGEIRWVSTPTRWRGRSDWADIDAREDHRFRDRIAVDMRRWPPV